MKKFYLLFVTAFLCAQLFSQTLFTYGSFSVDKDEFLKAYNKNKTTVTDKEKALREYLDLYSKFKLKVRAARDQKLDTLSQLQYDLQSFRAQVEEGYLNNESAVNKLVDEAFVRIQTDRHVGHYFIPLPAKTTQADSLKAVSAMNELYNSIKQGSTDPEKLITQLSSKYTRINYRDLGFITALTLPYEYEQVIYSVKTGDVAKPYRSKNGLHLFKVLEERKSAGKWKIAQILLALPPGDPSAFSNVQRRADSIYNLLKNGADFSQLAKQFSEDKLTYQFGGEMPEFTTGKFEYAFEKEVFKLARVGDFSKPISTPFGFHIVKKIAHTPTATDKNDAGFMYDLKQKVLQDGRINQAKENFTKEVIAKMGYKRNPAVKNELLYRYADSIALNLAAGNVNAYPISKKNIFSLGKINITGADWLGFIKDYKGNTELYQGEDNPALFNKFIGAMALYQYKTHLEDYNNEFRYQMQEFREGNMLFEVMERNVWGSAANDTMGLKQYYNANKNKYVWGPSANVIIFNSNTLENAKAAVASLQSGKDWKSIVSDLNNQVLADSGRYETAQLALAAGDKIAEGKISTPVVNSIDGTTSFVKFLKVHAPGEQRNFEEARGLVINDYQNIIEEKWMQALKKKYPVKVNEAVFASLLK